MAMHSAKLAGKGRFEIFDADMRAASVARLQLETEFRRAIERNEFENYYQAIVSLKTGRIYGFEALVRWQNPSRGLVPPAEFIPLAEETGLIVPLGQWVLETACRQISLWQSRFSEDPPLTVSVNLSAKHFLQSDLWVHCNTLLKDITISRNSLVLEITESTLMKDHDASIKLMQKIKDLDIRIAMDDFGTGYSSLSYLHQFPFDSLKIDQSFLSRVNEDDEMVRTILALGHNLGLKVVAEGVETLEQVDMLRALGCDYGQGYYFSKPITAQEATMLLEKHSGASLIP
jgi:EAL domain-containing protein (putative c-di-GMP-specific phosphodiesterase class I)